MQFKFKNILKDFEPESYVKEVDEDEGFLILKLPVLIITSRFLFVAAIILTLTFITRVLPILRIVLYSTVLKSLD